MASKRDAENIIRLAFYKEAIHEFAKKLRRGSAVSSKLKKKFLDLDASLKKIKTGEMIRKVVGK